MKENIQKQNNNNIENYSEQKDKNKEEKYSGENYDGLDEKRKERNEFISEVIEIIKKNKILKSNLTIITDEINKEIRKFSSMKL